MAKFDKSTLEINDIWANRFERGDDETQVLGIDWSCNIGWGRYELFFNEGDSMIKARSEHMNFNDDKNFLKALLEKVVDMAEIVD